jgi:hypothetical protein
MDLFCIGQSNRDEASGWITGLPVSGRTNGPSAHWGKSLSAAKGVQNSVSPKANIKKEYAQFGFVFMGRPGDF